MTTALGLARPGPDPLIDGLLESIAQTAAALGLTARYIQRAEEESSVDVLLIVGYPRSYAAFLDAPHSARRIAWFGEPLPRPASDVGIRPIRLRPAIEAGLRGLKGTVGPMTRRPLPGPFGRLRETAAIAEERTSNLGDAIRCARAVDRVVVTSRDRARILAQHAITAAVVPFGYHSAGAGPLVAPDGTSRDIQVVVVGSGLTELRLRRGRVLGEIAPALKSLGTTAGLEGVWGAERDAILRRTRVVLDIQRIPGNFTGLRFLTTMAAGAVMVTEPLDDPYPFEPGTDHLEATPREIARVVAAVLSDEPRRVAIARAGQARLADDLSMRASLERVLAG